MRLLLDGRLNPLRDESVTLSGPNTQVRIRRERCCNTRVENHIQQGDTHSEQVKATTHHNKPPTTPQNCSPEADVSSHTNQNSFDFILLIQCLTSGPKKPHRDQFLSLDQLKLYRLHWADLSPTLGPRWTHSVTWTEFFIHAFCSLRLIWRWSDCFSEFGWSDVRMRVLPFDRRSVWTICSSTVSCSAVFSFLFFLTVIVSCIETKFRGVSSHIISNLYTKHSAPLSSPHLLWCIFIPGVPDVHVNLCWREPCFQHEQIPSFDAVDADVKRYFDIIMSAAVWTMWTCLIFKINELFILFQRTKHQKSDRSRKSLEWTQIFLY